MFTADSGRKGSVAEIIHEKTGIPADLPGLCSTMNCGLPLVSDLHPGNTGGCFEDPFMAGGTEPGDGRERSIVSGESGQTMVEKAMLLAFLIVPVVLVFSEVIDGFVSYYSYLVSIICLPIP